MKTLTIAVAGCGSRGLDTYSRCQHRFADRMRIVAAADIRKERLEMMQDEFNVPESMCFASAEEMLAQDKLADIMIIATPDRCHYHQAMAALRKGYHLLLEKPIALSEQECIDIEKLALEKNLHVVVCHVLRHTVFYQKLKKALEEVASGDVLSVHAIERVCYWHQAHSFVRGNWRNSIESSPMILQKCCHDMDILLWLVGKNCLRVSSFGSLSHYTATHAPDGAPARCTDGCPVGDSCPYNAVSYYGGLLKRGKTGWPVNVVCSHPTEENLMNALRHGPYGRCVYRCDNDVVDHQVVNLELEGGATVNFTMCAFTAHGGREIRLMGTKGEIVGNMETNIIRIMPFGGEETEIDVNKLTQDLSGHGGGDARMLDEFLHLVASGAPAGSALTGISHSVQSHRVAFAAEASRLQHGAVITL